MQMLPNSVNARLEHKGVPLRVRPHNPVAHLFTRGEEGAWYDPSDLSTLFQDSAGTTPVTTAGQPVGLMLDKTDNTYNALQATSAARPTYVVASNGDSVLQNDEIDDALAVTFPNMGIACTVAFVTQGSVYLEEDITLNGAYTLPQRDLLGFVAIDRALTVVEKIQLIRYLASKSQGVNYGVDLGAMALTAISAVDVFVYDTTKDTDGGAWVNGTLAQASSWYSETLNTATRGATRPFPAQALIVQTATVVTIYDATDPSLPMWIVFPVGSAANIYRSAGSTIGMLQGILWIGNSAFSLTYANFISDDANLISTNRLHNSRTIAQRSGGPSWAVTTTGGGLVHNTVNDVAMTVLADAPIDAATGLQVPTIAVGTNGGTSVINNDGTVIDLTLFSRAINKVTFDESGNGLWVASGRNAVHYYETLPTSDSSSEPAIRLITSGYSSPNIGGGFLGDAIEAIEGGAAISSTLLGLVNFLPYGSSSLTGGSMLSYGASTYNTGWMHGDIKGAWLSSVDATDLVGTELITNGDFATNIDDWSFSVVGGGSGSQSFSSGKLRLENSTLTGSVRSSQGVSSFIVGKTYTISADFTVISGNPTNARLTISGLVDIATPVSNGSVSYTFVAGATSYSVLPSAIQTGSGSAVTIEWDNITLRLADPDRSVNGNGLATYGTVTKTAVATGAELMAYSRFSASNYLEQPYNSDLDFGTGDFHVMGWVKTTALGAAQQITGKDITASVSGDWYFRVGTAGALEFGYRNVSNGVSSLVVTAGSWAFVAYTRLGGVGTFYLNDTLLVQSDGSGVNVSNSKPLRVGAKSDGATPFNGSISLLRIGAGAPSAAQVLKAYNDELPLFQENGAATIFGASDAVTALAHDPDTDLLHVGTSAGRSVFRGLERINNTSTSISTAISASGGLIVEK
jgi:hypothetical protein